MKQSLSEKTEGSFANYLTSGFNFAGKMIHKLFVGWLMLNAGSLAKGENKGREGTDVITGMGDENIFYKEACLPLSVPENFYTLSGGLDEESVSMIWPKVEMEEIRDSSKKLEVLSLEMNQLEMGYCLSTKERSFVQQLAKQRIVLSVELAIMQKIVRDMEKEPCVSEGIKSVVEQSVGKILRNTEKIKALEKSLPVTCQLAESLSCISQVEKLKGARSPFLGVL